ncbi:MAG: SBBP repeat-containing protein, partial [Candidatus Hydrogenedentes bacterium]|nr:SBBP repeat-containing protein [Candidatus Hydrogenedentota bacterium]
MRSLARGFTMGLLALCLVSSGLAAPLLAAGAPPILWSRQFGSGGGDEATAVAVDGSHNVFVGGNTAGDLYGP